MALSQITNVTNDQSTPIPGSGHDYIHMLTETVNPANGSVSLRIQVPVPKGRGLTLPFSFAYDSNGVNVLFSVTGQAEWRSNTTFLSQGGWSYGVPLLSANDLQRTINGQTCPVLTDYVFQDASGNRHALGLASVYSSPQCPGDNGHLSGGDDLVRASVTNCPNGGLCYPVAVADADGTTFLFNSPNAHSVSGGNFGASLPYAVEDRNGNEISITDSGGGAFTIKDTVGRQAVVSSGFGANGGTISVSGLGGPYTIYWGSVNSSFSVNAGNAGPNTYCRGISGVSLTHPVITAIKLPNGEEYQFSYDSTYGLLNQITYPTGGWVKYSWSLNSQSEFGAFTDTQGANYGCEYTYDWPAVAHRYVSFDGSTFAQQQDFSYSTSWNSGKTAWVTKQDTITTHDELRGASFQTAYTYTPFTIPNAPYDEDYFATQVPLESTVQYKDWSGTTLQTVSKTWDDQYELQKRSVTLNNGLVAETDYGYGSGAQVTEKDEYDYGSGSRGSLLRKTVTNYAGFAATPIYTNGPSIFDRPSSVITYDGSGNRAAETDYSYDGTTVGGSTGFTGHDDTNYGTGYNNRGNATSKTEWLNTGGASAVTTYAYDLTGQMLAMTDPCGNSTCSDMTGSSHTTQYSYADNYASGSPPGPTNAYLTQITYPATSAAHIEKFSYNFASGESASSTDQNNNATSYDYNDSLGRLTETAYPDGGQTLLSYDDSPGSVSVTATKKISSSENYVSVSLMDGVGHVTETQLTSDPAGTDFMDSTYDGEGLVWKQSNPYRSQSESTYGITTTTYDALARATSITRPDGNVASTSYSGNCSTATDEAGKARETCSDGLGRLTQVFEDPNGLNYQTSYGYDALDNLLSVSQSSQTRSFVYDSLSRELSAANPESGTTTYTYDANGNVATRVDARNITTTYGYDALNRLTSKTYSDGTWEALFGYDQTTTTIGSVQFNVSNGTGRLSWTYSGNYPNFVQDAYNYDPMGRITDYYQCGTPGSCNPSRAHYNYDLAGDIQSWTHPGGPTLTNTINGAQQVTQISYSPADSTHPSNFIPSISYTPFGTVLSLQDGCVGSGCTNAVETYTYNNRLQPVLIDLGNASNPTANYCMVYNYYSSVGSPASCSVPSQGSGNNGSVMGFLYQDNVNSSLSHTEGYTYDSVNRLTNAVAVGNSKYNLTFAYDSYGNMSCQVNGNTNGLCPQYTFNQATNRISTPGFSYDAAGHLTQDGSTNPANTYQWDAEGRLSTILRNGATFETMVYNAHGQVVESDYPGYNAKVDGVFDPTGRELGYYDGASGNWYDRDFWAAGRMVAQSYPSDTYFLHANALDSDTQVTDYSGAVQTDFLYYPWQNWNALGNVVDAHFAGFEQSQGPNYGTPTRTYSGGQGRWLTPDPDNAGADPSNPQSWNAYSYALNNPATNTDPSGLYCTQDSNGNLVDVGNEGESCADVEASNAAEERNPSVVVTGTPGNVAEAVGVNFGIGITNLMTSNANTFYTTLTVGQFSPNLPQVPGGSGIAANIGAIAPLVGAALIGPEGEAGEVAQGARRLLPFGEELSGRVNKVIEAAEAGIQRFAKDGTVFENREGLLPVKPYGYYKEYTVDPIGGISGRGVERIVTGQGGEVYYTNYHYQSGTFVRIR